MIKTIDNKIHHLKELNVIERELYSEVLTPKKFYEDLANFFNTKLDLKTKDYLTAPEVNSVDDWVKDYFTSKIDEFKVYIVRAYIIGRLLAESDKTAAIFSIKTLTELPESVKDAARQYNLTLDEANALKRITENAGVNLTNTSADTAAKVRQALIESFQAREGSKGAERRLRETQFDEVKDLNRDFARVAITEVNSAFNNGYLSQMEAGEYVCGISMPDACEHCLEDINGKIYKVLKVPPPEYINLTGKAREEIEVIWEHYVWEGKTNIGRSSSKRKRINPEAGNKVDNLTDRHHHERSMPSIPMHPFCRCRWILFNPKFEWVDKDGKIRLSIEDRQAHADWYKENFE